jgi:hypothetical protein
MGEGKGEGDYIFCFLFPEKMNSSPLMGEDKGGGGFNKPAACFL